MLLRRMLQADRMMSVLFYGPPGTGKTTLAELIAGLTQSHFEQLNAASTGVREVRSVLDAARERLEVQSRRTILFLDEIHRFNRAQQDILLGDVERGVIRLIGATTENPFFSVNSPLVSRSQIFQFLPLTELEIIGLLIRALQDRDRGFGALKVRADDDALAHLAVTCDGDARRALTALEVAVLSLSSSGDDLHITREVAEQSVQRKAIVYDGTGDEHYDAISALIKSMRGSDPDAAVYWLARMLEAGEDPRFIARRIAILASEDIGNADPQALVVASAAQQVTERIGMPECQLTLAQAVIYMCAAPKSNASAEAIWSALSDVREGRTLPIPKHLRDGSYPGAKRFGHGEGYQYPHDDRRGFIEQDYLGARRNYYSPSNRGFEVEIGHRLRLLREQHPEADSGEQKSDR